ncbi:MAG: LamG domain-containing protein [Tolypothrix carrinoi HA7290-LM1]|jgi:hypothetical protein|nr:LamG domain-containing protein [Tolypothrix carrinoi HA7290-LM1]
MKISGFPAIATANNNDKFLLESASSGAFQHITKANFLSGLSTGSSGVSWERRTTDFGVTNDNKVFLDNSSALTITFPATPTSGIEIELARKTNVSKVVLTGIDKLNGVSIVTNDEIRLLYSANSTKFIYLGSVDGWYSIPQSGVRIKKPLSLPTSTLAQKFYALDITGLANNASIAQWNDTSGNSRHAIQGTTNLKPIYKTGIFDPDLPAVTFDGSKYLTFASTYLSGVKYTVAIVEARANNAATNYLFGQDNASDNQALHVGYRTDGSFTLAQYSNDLDVSIAGYSGFSPNIWVVSNNSRGKEIWRNGSLIASSTDTNNLTSGTNGRIGRALNSNFNGHIGLLATWTGDKSTSETIIGEYEELFKANSELCLAKNKEIEAYISVPDYWQTRSFQKPQLLIQFAENLGDGKIGRGRWSLVIPHYRYGKNHKPNFPDFEKGDVRGIQVLNDNSQIIVWCKSEAECIRVINAFKQYVDPDYLKGILPIETAKYNRKLRNVSVTPTLCQFFPLGQKDTVPEWSRKLRDK